MNTPRSGMVQDYWKDGWDINRYREDNESEDHWELRRLFIERWKTVYPEERLLCLAEVFANMEWLGCQYPTEVMKEVAGLSHEIIEAYRSSRSDKLKKTLVTAADSYKPMDGTIPSTAPMAAYTFSHSEDTTQLVSLPLHSTDVGCPSSVIPTEVLPPSSMVLDETSKTSCSSVQSKLSHLNMMLGITSTLFQSDTEVINKLCKLPIKDREPQKPKPCGSAQLMIPIAKIALPTASEVTDYLQPDPINKQKENPNQNGKPCSFIQTIQSSYKLTSNTSIPTDSQSASCQNLPVDQYTSWKLPPRNSKYQNPKSWGLTQPMLSKISISYPSYTSQVGTNELSTGSIGVSWQIVPQEKSKAQNTDIISAVDTETAINEALDKNTAREGKKKTIKKNKKQRRKARLLREAAATATMATTVGSDSHIPVQPGKTTANLKKTIVSTATNTVIVYQPTNECPQSIKGTAIVNPAKRAKKKAKRLDKLSQPTMACLNKIFTTSELNQVRHEPSSMVKSTHPKAIHAQVAEKRTGSNEIVTPKEEARIEPPFEMVATTYKEAAAANLVAAVTTDIYAPLDAASATYVLEALTNQIVKEAMTVPWDTIDNSPKFVAEPRHTHGQLRVCCANENTLAWLKEQVAKLRLPSGERLIATRLSEIPARRRIRCGILVPGRWDDAKEIEKTLRFQNPWAQVDRWWFHGSDIQEKRKELSTFVVVTMPEDIIPTIMKEQRRLAFCLGSIYVKFFDGPKLVKRLPLPTAPLKASTSKIATPALKQEAPTMVVLDALSTESDGTDWAADNYGGHYANQNL
ncbi:uncharacterized protein LOC126378358 [Pectinophora gossypiella]|uniref:uncharacterized protein LOC126378358 n=1 Tax=Pectinophora gossypiella TaxID=13191 RepID=UPI00214E9E56|nr:uncharacterized protein LOC126378358 [Pectinophora gossypiella]